MKKFILGAISFLMFFTISPINAKAEEKNSITYEMALDSVTEQLEEQNAIGLLPVYVEILNKDFGMVENQISSSSYSSKSYSSRASSAYFPNGGSIYYANYMGKGAKVSEVYLNKSETEKHLTGSRLDSVVAFLLSIPVTYPGSGLVSTLLAANGWHSERFRRTVEKGSGRIKIVSSEDKYDSAVVTFHWSNAPYATYSSGAKVTRK